jgi:hypothetical protein
VTWHYDSASAANTSRKSAIFALFKKAYEVVKSQQEWAIIGPQCPNFLRGNMRKEMLGENVEQD